MTRLEIRDVHTNLIKINGVKVKLEEELKELVSLRKNVSDNQRTKLETKIGIRKVMIKDLLEIDLNTRELL